MPDTGDRHDHNPENKTEFNKFNNDFKKPMSRFGGTGKNNLAQANKRFMAGTRNRKASQRSK